jgi:hypothetical protein
MIYDLSNILEKQRFKRRCNQLYKAGVMVELAEKKPKRTIPQNAYLHLILGWFAIETGNTLDFVKQKYFKQHVNPDIFIIEVDAEYIGKVQVLRSSRDLDTAEMTKAIDNFREWSFETTGIYLPVPNEQDFLREIEKEMARQKMYL